MPAAAGGPSEAAVEATYLYKFAPFVTWPATDDTRPFTICIVGDDPFGPLLDRAVAGQALGTRSIRIAKVETIGRQSTCDIAYLGGSAESVAEMLKAARGAPILTVTDEDDPPGIIAFAIVDGHVRFRVDQAQAQQNGLAISSKLLSLALSVRGGGGEP